MTSLPASDMTGITAADWPADLRRTLLAIWAAFWLLMILVSMYDNLGNTSVLWWQPLLWEGSSALVWTVLLVLVWRYSLRQTALLHTPWRWFWQHIKWLPLMSALFTVGAYGLRHAVYALLDQQYTHESWLYVWPYETLKIALFLGLWLGVLFGVFSYVAAREQQTRLQRMQQALTEARLQHLQSQLRPHFLFNALNTISALIHEQPARADSLLHQLSQLLRVYLAVEPAAVVTLAEEIRVLQLYADIMSSRFAPRVQLQWQLAPSALELSLPALLLQPLLENAFRHGVEPSLVPVLIEVSAECAGHALEVRITNAPMSTPPALASLPSSGNGIGLRNCQERLRMHFGERASLQTSADNGGFAVTIRIEGHCR